MAIDYSKSEKFLATLGLLIVTWNLLETTTRHIVTMLSGDTSATAILTANLGNVGIREALETLANESADPELRPHLLHFADFFDRLREHRNWLAHSIIVAEGGSGYSQTVSARTKYILHQKITEISEIEACIEHLATASRYASRIFLALAPAHIVPPGLPPPSSLEKPPLPDRLQKPRQFQRRGENQPPS